MALIDSTLKAVLQKRREFAPNVTFPVVVTPTRGSGRSILRELERMTRDVATDDDGNFVVELSIPEISEIADSDFTEQLRMKRVYRASAI
jgi:hypothetical protein